jgi:hypothetical protein
VPFDEIQGLISCSGKDKSDKSRLSYEPHTFLVVAKVFASRSEWQRLFS